MFEANLCFIVHSAPARNFVGPQNIFFMRLKNILEGSLGGLIFFCIFFLRLKSYMYSSNNPIAVFPQVDNTYMATHNQMKRIRRVQHA